MLLKIPQSDIPPDLKLKVGERVMLGNGLEASVKEVGQDQTVLDCNPPLAGKALDLEVKLKDLTKVSPSLLVHAVTEFLRTGLGCKTLSSGSKLADFELPCPFSAKQIPLSTTGCVQNQLFIVQEGVLGFPKDFLTS